MNGQIPQFQGYQVPQCSTYRLIDDIMELSQLEGSNRAVGTCVSQHISKTNKSYGVSARVATAMETKPNPCTHVDDLVDSPDIWMKVRVAQRLDCVILPSDGLPFPLEELGE